MRKLRPSHVVTSIVVAIAGAGAVAQAQGATATAGSRIVAGNATNGNFVTATSAAIPSPASTTSIGATQSTDSSARVVPSNATTTDTRNAQTLQATANNRSSGPSPTTTGSSTSSTTPSSGSTGPSGSTGTTGTETTGTNTTTPNLANPLLMGGAFNGMLNGDILPTDLNGNLQVDQGNGVATNNTTTIAADTARSSANLDRVIKSAERDRKKIGRNGQLLYSIAPRTNVDRSNEVPDDGPTPALKGLVSR